MTTGTKVRWALLGLSLAGGVASLFGPSGRSWRGCYSSRRTALVFMHNIGWALENYRTAHRKLPDSLDTLTHDSGSDREPFLRDIPNDPWGDPFDYEIHGPKTYLLRSRGEDGLPDTKDDICWPETKE